MDVSGARCVARKAEGMIRRSTSGRTAGHREVTSIPSRAHRLFTSFVPDRRELLPRYAMRVRCEPSPAYLAKLQKRWRIVVPVSGRLSPAVVGEFETESEARTWLGSPEGQSVVAAKRGRVRAGGTSRP